MIASSAFRVYKLPCVGYCDDYSIGTRLALEEEALAAFTDFNDVLHVQLGKRKSGAGPEIESLGIAVYFTEPNLNITVGLQSPLGARISGPSLLLG